MNVCRSCGATHPEGTRLCPRTRGPLDHGPCGTRVDRYQVERLLGAGGFGGVYIATHVNLGQRVAIKLLNERIDSDPLAAERFLREARAAAAITSPHVVRVTDFGETPSGEAFLVMELLAGRDLDAMLRAAGGPLPESLAISIMLEVLAGLSAAHRAGVVHRDLKPANVFLAQDAGREIAKIVDFGISHARLRPEDRTLTAAGMILGTPAYMAPEQIQGRPVDQRVDIYAAGVVLYQMLSGALPHDAETFERLVVLVCTEEPRPLRTSAPHLPIALAQVVDRAVAREPSARFASADDFAEALRNATGVSTGKITAPLGSRRADHFAPTEAQTTPASLRPAAPVLYTPTSIHPQTEVARQPGAPTGLAPAHPPASIALPVLVIGGVLAAAIAVVVAAALVMVLLQRDDAPPRTDSTLVPYLAPPASEPQSAPTTIAPVVPQPVELPQAAQPQSAQQPAAQQPVVQPQSAQQPAAQQPAAQQPVVQPRSATASGVHWSEPRTVGDGIDTAAVRAVLRRISATCEECRRPDRAAHVSAQLMFRPNGAIAIAQANPNEPNDTEASRCVANRFREAAGNGVATGGILVIDAELDPL